MERDEEEREEKGSWLGGTGSYGRRGGVLMLARQNFGRRVFWGRARALIGRRRGAVIGRRVTFPAQQIFDYQQIFKLNRSETMATDGRIAANLLELLPFHLP